jgi:hypothetical protein
MGSQNRPSWRTMLVLVETSAVPYVPYSSDTVPLSVGPDQNVEAFSFPNRFSGLRRRRGTVSVLLMISGPMRLGDRSRYSLDALIIRCAATREQHHPAANDTVLAPASSWLHLLTQCAAR